MLVERSKFNVLRYLWGDNTGAHTHTHILIVCIVSGYEKWETSTILFRWSKGTFRSSTERGCLLEFCAHSVATNQICLSQTIERLKFRKNSQFLSTHLFYKSRSYGDVQFDVLSTSGGQSRSMRITSKATMSIHWFIIEPIEGVVRPNSPCTNSLMYVPASVVISSMIIRWSSWAWKWKINEMTP